jgi:hypothetical protein
MVRGRYQFFWFFCFSILHYPGCWTLFEVHENENQVMLSPKLGLGASPNIEKEGQHERADLSSNCSRQLFSSVPSLQKLLRVKLSSYQPSISSVKEMLIIPEFP